MPMTIPQEPTTNEVTRGEGEGREDYGKRILQNMVGKSERYIKAFRAAGGCQR